MCKLCARIEYQPADQAAVWQQARGGARTASMHRGRARAGLLLMWTLATVQITPALVDTAAQPRCDASKLVSLSDRSAAIASATSPQSRRDTLIAWPQFKIAQAMSFRHDFPQEDWTIEQLSESETHTCVRVSGRTRCVINVGLFATPEGTVYSRYQTGWLESISNSGALTDMCSGDLFTCGILASPDRRLRCWGDPVACEQGVCSPPTVLSGFAELTCGTYHACAIEVGTGSMHCWGSNDDRQAQAPQGPFRAVSAAARHTCGLRKSGHVECWGSNEGVGESEGVSTWQAKPPPVLLQAVAAGDMHSCGILAPPRPTQSARPPAGGRIVCWGDNRRLQASPPSFRAVAIFCGAQHSCAVTADGNLLVCWGDKTIANRFRANEQDGPASPPQHLTICPPDNQGRSIRHYELHYSGFRAIAESVVHNHVDGASMAVLAAGLSPFSVAYLHLSPAAIVLIPGKYAQIHLSIVRRSHESPWDEGQVVCFFDFVGGLECGRLPLAGSEGEGVTTGVLQLQSDGLAPGPHDLICVIDHYHAAAGEAGVMGGYARLHVAESLPTVAITRPADGAILPLPSLTMSTEWKPADIGAGRHADNVDWEAAEVQPDSVEEAEDMQATVDIALTAEWYDAWGANAQLLLWAGKHLVSIIPGPQEATGGILKVSGEVQVPLSLPRIPQQAWLHGFGDGDAEVQVRLRAELVDHRRLPIPGGTTSVTLNFRQQENDSEVSLRGGWGLGGVLSACREIKHTLLKSDQGGPLRTCTVPHVRRRQSIHVGRTDSQSCRAFGDHDPVEGLVGFWHIFTLASDWARQAQEALDAFGTLAAARSAQEVQVMISGPFAHVVASWFSARRHASSSPEAVWSRIHIQTMEDLGGFTRIQYQRKFLDLVLDWGARGGGKLAWVTSTGLEGLAGSGGSWHRATFDATSFDLHSAWAVLARPAGCVAALHEGHFDVCASCVELDPVLHLPCHTFWVHSSFLHKVDGLVLEKELFSLHHELMCAECLVNTWQSSIVQDLARSMVTAPGGLATVGNSKTSCQRPQLSLTDNGRLPVIANRSSASGQPDWGPGHLHILSPGFMESTMRHALLVRTEICTGPFRKEGSELAFARVLAYVKDISWSYVEIHVDLDLVPGEDELVLETKVDLTPLIPHIPPSHGPASEIVLVVSVFAGEWGGVHRDNGQVAHTNTAALPAPKHPPRLSAQTRFILYRQTGAQLDLDLEARPPAAARPGVFLASSPARVKAFNDLGGESDAMSKVSCTSRKISTFCNFEFVRYVRDQRHATLEYQYWNGDETSGNTTGNTDRALTGVPTVVDMVHRLQCCPQYHARLPLRPIVKQGDFALACDVFVEHQSFLFGVVNSFQYGHVLHETVFALFHTILTTVPPLGRAHDEDLQDLPSLPRNLLFISDILDPSNVLGKMMPLLQAFSDLPWLSLSSLRSQGRVVCFQRLSVGLSDGMNMFATQKTLEEDGNSSPVARASHVRLMRATVFSSLQASIQEIPVTLSARRVAFIHRSESLTTRRGIFNMDELLAAASEWAGDAFLLEFENMSLVQQVEVMQSVTVLVGVTGTGLWNAIWMRRGGLGVQLFPFGVGFKGGIEFEHAIRHGPGHYQAWHSPKYFKNTMYANGHESCSAPRGCWPDELLSPALNVPALAINDPEAYWAQDWGGAWLFYYGQDALYVDPADMVRILGNYEREILQV